MSDMMTPAPQPAGGAAQENLKTLAIVCYVLFLVGPFTGGFTALVGGIIAYIKRGDAAGSAWASHFDNVITVFWVALIVAIAGWLTVWFLIGFAILFALVIWYLYRNIRGLLRASENRAY